MQHEVSIEIDRPIDEVFQIATQHMADWSIVVVEDEVIEETADGVGTTFHLVTEDKGKRMEFGGVVTKHDPPRKSAVRMSNSILVIDTEFTFTENEGRTRVTQLADVRGKGFFKFMMFLFGWLTRKSSCDASQNELESLKRYCEGGAQNVV